MVTVAIIGLVTAIVFPTFATYRESVTRKACIENISKIESAKQTWGLENNKKSGDIPLEADIFGLNGYIRTKVTCPASGLDYDLKGIGDPAQCKTPGHDF